MSVLPIGFIGAGHDQVRPNPLFVWVAGATIQYAIAVRDWVDFDFDKDKNVEFEPLQEQMHNICDEQWVKTEEEMGGYKEKFKDTARKSFKLACKDMEKQFKVEWLKAQAKKLNPNLVELRKEFGADSLLQEDLSLNGIVSKKQFLNLRNDKKTLDSRQGHHRQCRVQECELWGPKSWIVQD